MDVLLVGDMDLGDAYLPRCGVLTIIVGIIGVWRLVDVPNKATFLTEEERTLVNTRIERDRADAEDDPITGQKILTYLSDWKLWLYGLMFMSNNLATCESEMIWTMLIGRLAGVLPPCHSRIHGLCEYKQSTSLVNSAHAQDYIGTMLLGTPTYAWALFPSLICSFIADKYPGMRAAMVMFNGCCTVTGTAMFSKLAMSQKTARYVGRSLHVLTSSKHVLTAGVFLAVGGANANVGLLVSWFQTNLRKQSKRAVSSALVILWGGIGGILAGYTMMNKEARKG